MIVNYNYVNLFSSKLGIDPNRKFDTSEAKMFLEEYSLQLWDLISSEYPDFFEIMNNSGNLFTYLVRHGKTIELVKETGISGKMDPVLFGLLRLEYVTQSLFDIHYFQKIIDLNNSKFSNDFLDIMYSEHGLLYKRLDQNFHESFTFQAGLFSKAIEKSMVLVQDKLRFLRETEDAAIDQTLAAEESRIYINELINHCKL